MRPIYFLCWSVSKLIFRSIFCWRVPFQWIRYLSLLEMHVVWAYSHNFPGVWCSDYFFLYLIEFQCPFLWDKNLSTWMPAILHQRSINYRFSWIRLIIIKMMRHKSIGDRKTYCILFRTSTTSIVTLEFQDINHKFGYWNF